MEKITLNSGKVIVTDPCYEPNCGCNTLLNNVLSGTWICTVVRKNYKDWGNRIQSLMIRHEDYRKGRFNEQVGFAAVDSGQCGFFDPEYFEKNQPDDDFDNLKSWYRRVCEITLHEPSWGTIEGLGVVSESGYGDGCYEIRAVRNESGYIVGLKLRYI